MRSYNLFNKEQFMATKIKVSPSEIEGLAKEFIKPLKELHEFTKAENGTLEYKWEMIIREILKKQKTGKFENKDKLITINKKVKDYVEEFFSKYET